MANTNQIICLSTFDYSSLGPAFIATHCPSCGLRLDVRQENILNRYSPVLLLLGASAYVIYKFCDFKPKMKRISNKFWQLLGYEINKLEPVFFINTSADPLVAFSESKLRTSGHWDTSDVPDLDLPTPRTPRSALWNQIDFYFFNNNNIFSDKSSTDLVFNENNYTSKSAKSRTVAKIDEVLTQIDDLKKSIVEMDSDISGISGQKYANFNPEFLTLTNTDLTEEYDDNYGDLRSVTDVSDVDDDYYLKHLSSTPLQEVNLEWDLTDVETDNSYYGSEDLELMKALTLPVTDSDKQRIKSMQELLEEAKQMGLLNNILDAITCKVKDFDNSNRDSAYFED